MEVISKLEVDSRLQLPNHAVFVGMSMSGKTRLVLQLISDLDRLNPIPKTVYFYYDQYQPSYAESQSLLKKRGVQLLLRRGSDVKLDDFEKTPHQTLVIIDDATEETSSSKAIAKLVTNGRHRFAPIKSCTCRSWMRFNGHIFPGTCPCG